MTRPVFLADPSLDLASLEPGERVALGGDEGRHAATVRRIGAGEELDLADGAGVRATCVVVDAAKSGLDLEVVSVEVEPEPEPRLLLVQALAKGGRDEQAIETCTEIGIDEVVPWQSDRAIVRWAGPKADKGRAKWESVVRAAAKQARRARVPEVGPLVDTRALATLVRSLIDEGGRVYVCHEEATTRLAEILADRPIGTANALAIVVGPEGGISPDEVGALEDAGAELVGLGRNVLRSSTAGAVCATLLAAASGRM